ncbi:glycerophosphodiester phosphodiesterase family protein [Paenibacillus radicis (ex Xue et al. 2023)]|uniref:S-layer homology domain-containing protein n=1 Tax=Paenibacillus radicis (ex Xue et al. 2023) TaxID=2972489 RepID=A0ABT1YDT0_9BACL|nr:glycerophosphodiester phosphodiesterase family protein [Paenibacillus radicis (ex Xue et al. 2023)]MCR8631346.1 S-layer homology domain-containing protein [Paenibacillus radicis (ex Xue et al. 2023)]
MKKRIAKLLQMTTIAALISSLFQPAAYLPQAHAADAGRKSLEVNKTLTAPIIDGKLDESLWKIDQPLTAKVGQGTFKDSKFGLLWDNQYLYIGVKADDDNLISGASGNWFEQDNINLFFDPTQHQSGPFAKDDMQIGFVYQPNTTTPEFHFGAALNNHSGKDEKKILRAISKTATGWASEIAVPWDMLNFNPQLKKQLGLEISATDRYGADAAEQRTSYWSAYNSMSFWNDTSGYGSLTLVDSNPVSGSVNPVLLEDNFDGYAAGTLPPNWISDVNAGSDPFTVVKDTYGNGRMSFSGNAANKQSRITAPVQWDNYVIEADLRFEGVLNDARWASIMFRGASNGKNPYNQMAVRRNGTYELAYRMADNNWASPTPVSGTWQQLTMNTDYSLKVRVFDNNVKEYIKAKSSPTYTKLMDQNFNANLLERGKVGFQVDQSKASFDNLKVTRITADRLDVTMPATLEALSGETSVTSSVYFSDGITEAPPADRVKLYSMDESIIKISNNKLYPLKPGKVTIKAVYANADTSKEITVTPSLSGVKAVSLKHDEGYILTVTDQAINPNTITLKAEFNDLSTGTVTGDQVAWTSTSSDIVITGGQIVVKKKGIYTITGTKDRATVSIMVVAKDAGDAEYVLYEENFDNLAAGTLPAGWTRKEGTTASAAVVKSGAFEINASASPDNPSRVLLPSYLGSFGNYKIEADVTHLAANDTARWHSIMYRIQNHDFPYYQMAVRQDATAVNGIEFAERTPANAWNVIDRGSNTEAIDPAKMYHYTVKVHGNRVQESINNRIIVDTDAATAYTKGEIGLQSNGSKMKVDNIRVTLQQDALPPIPNGRFVTVAEPDTRIAAAASIVTELQSAGDLAKLSGSSLPSTVILHVAPGLKVTDSTGKTEIGSLESLLGSIEGRIIPTFYVKDESTVDQLVEYLKSNNWEDAAVVSDNGELIKRARTAYPVIRGIVDFSAASDLSKDKLLEVRRKTAASLARIAILPQSVSTRDNVSYLQARMIMVWTKDVSSQADKNINMHQLITTGVNGIVTDTPATALSALKVYSNNTTLIRKPYIIAHRGMPSESPENTIESNRMGLEAGAEFIENDMYLTKDGRIAILHDGSLERTTNGTGNIEDYTMEELKKLNANKPFPKGFPDVKIPTLDEQIDLAREKGAMVMAEIKTSTPAAVDAYVKLIKDMNAEALVDTMSFDMNQLKRMAELMPEMPLGLLTGGYASETNVNKSLRETIKLLQSLNASYNTSYSGLGKNFTEAAKHRGIIISPWTFNNKNDFMTYMKLGVFGITTDYALWASDWAASIKPEKDQYDLAKDESLSLKAVVKSYEGKEKTIDPDVIVLDGQDVIELNGSSITAKKAGIAHLLLRYTSSMEANNTYDIYTQPVTLQVAGAIPAAPTGLTATAGNTQVTLSWSSVTEATYYTVKRSTTSGGPYTVVVSSVSNPTYTDTGLTNGTTYYYVVTAGNAAGQSADATQVSATPAAVITIPAAPTGLTATAGNTQVTLGWSSVTEATYYAVKRGTTSGGPYTVVASSVSNPTYTDTGLTNGTTYYYVVTAGNASGESANSDQASAAPTAGNSGNHSRGGGSSSTGTDVNQPGATNQSTDLIEAKDGTVDLSKLKESLNNYSKVQVKLTGDKLMVPAASLAEASKDAGKLLVVTSDNATYTMPLSILKLETLAQQLGVSVDDLSIQFILQKLSGSEAAAVQDAIAAMGGKQAADAVHFEVEAINKAGQTVRITLGATYVSREIAVNKAIDPKKATGVRIIPGSNELRFVPSLFFTKDGITTAIMKRNGNSVYTVVENNKTFADLANHWAKEDIELLANKLVVDGVSDSRFEADRSITRAEFAALLVRSLAMDPAAIKASFSDVKDADWYAEAVATAVSAGIISGYEDGTFRPNKEITREEQAAMIIRAMTYAGVDAGMIQAQNKLGDILAPFKDAGKIVWAKTEIAAAIQSGLMNGMTADTLESGSHATRAQSAVLLKRFLSKVNFIN